ncbi:hypothetical protein [Herbaspirillum sp. NPDC101397]|uniref:hypothetical protein n=1 Tax=Herbaspirillum sp. NPDC101397 TaxID=3364006 RepID=UPI00383A6A49
MTDLIPVISYKVGGNVVAMGDAPVTYSLPVSLGGTGAQDAAGARVSLGLEIGVKVAAFNAAAVFSNAVNSYSKGQAGTPVALVDAATIAVDLDAANNFTLAIGGNRILGNPTNVKIGQSGVIDIKQDSTGARTLAFASYYKFQYGNVPVLTPTATTGRTLLAYYVLSATEIVIISQADVK